MHCWSASVRSERISITGDPTAFAAELRSLIPSADDVSKPVAEIIARVRAHGDEAVRDYTRRFDTAGRAPAPLEVTPAELDAAARALDEPVKEALELAIANVRQVAEAALSGDHTVELGHQTVAVKEAPVASAAVYVPGGRAPYPSTVVMGVVTAQVAGVEQITVCSPPGSTANQEVHPAVLAASRLAGAHTVYRMGGAQAIAALAYGTDTVKPVDVIVGPGNLYVQEAKRQVSSRVGIDGFAGPSDLVVIASPDADPELVALDLLAQAEHGEGTLVIAISSSSGVLEQVQSQLVGAPDTGATVRLITVQDGTQALELVEQLAPEHLQLVGAEAEPCAGRVTRAGCVFVGAASGTAFGDYIAGSNHVLPTAGTARFASALSPAHFRRRFYEVRISDPRALARAAAPLARAEGFELHALSMEARLDTMAP
jgi:histidinol dehydrogenase